MITIKLLGIGGFVFEQFLKLRTSSQTLFWAIIIIVGSFGITILSIFIKGWKAIEFLGSKVEWLFNFVINHPVICAIVAISIYIYIKSR